MYVSELFVDGECIIDSLAGPWKKTRGFGWGRFKEQQRRFKTAQKRRNFSGAPVPKCPDTSALSSIVCSQKESYTHTIKLITHVCTTNEWNKPANTMSCDSVVLCSYYFYFLFARK